MMVTVGPFSAPAGAIHVAALENVVGSRRNEVGLTTEGTGPDDADQA
jgi:hypothetical protein